MDIGSVIAALSLALALAVFLVNTRKDTRTDAAKEARTDAKLDNINNGVSEIRLDMRAMAKRLDGHETRLTRVESAQEEGSRRIDELERLFHQAHPPNYPPN